MSDEPSNEEWAKAIQQGVHDAFVEFLDNIDPDSVPRMIKEGVRMALDVYPSDVLDAITAGAKEALRR